MQEALEDSEDSVLVESTVRRNQKRGCMWLATPWIDLVAGARFELATFGLWAKSYLWLLKIAFNFSKFIFLGSVLPVSQLTMLISSTPISFAKSFWNNPWLSLIFPTFFEIFVGKIIYNVQWALTQDDVPKSYLTASTNHPSWSSLLCLKRYCSSWMEKSKDFCLKSLEIGRPKISETA